MLPEGTAGHMSRVGVFSNGDEKQLEGVRPIDKCEQFQGQIEDSDSLCQGKVTESFSSGERVVILASTLERNVHRTKSYC